MSNPLEVQFDTTRSPEVDQQLARRLRLVMVIDGGFLALVGTVVFTMELVGHFLGTGPLAAVFHQSPYSIGWVEAHGLAALTGALFLLAGARDRRRYWHGYGLAVHLLLGGTFCARFTPHQQLRQERPLAAGDQSHWDVSTSSVLRMMSTHTEGGFA